MSQKDRPGAHFVRVCSVADVQAAGRLTVHVEGQTLALFARGGEVHAVDNRCPHMGFPLDRGTVQDGILTCHWHHARFDLASGGTFDLWADDVRAFPAQTRDGEVWVDTSAREDPTTHRQRRLRDGLEHASEDQRLDELLELVELDQHVEHGKQQLWSGRLGRVLRP